MSSSVLAADKASNSGASLTGLNVNVKVVELVTVPSETFTVITESPTKLASGSTVNVLPSTVIVALPFVAEYVKSSPSTSLAVTSKTKTVSSSVD